MYLTSIFNSTFFLKSVFIASLFILIFISSISYKHTQSLAESSRWVFHSYKTTLELEQMISFIKDAETGQRGYIITHDTVFLQPYFNALTKVNNSYNKLKKLTVYNLKQQNNLDTLYNYINDRFKLLEVSLEIIQKYSLDKRVLADNMIKGKEVMDKIRVQINKMIELEMVYLVEMHYKYEQETSFTPFFILVLLLFSLLVFVFSYYKINNDLKIQMKTNEDLIITAASNEQAEEIGSYSSWKWNLDTNKLNYSKNQYRLLGFEPQSFELNIDKFIEFVHPHDKHIVSQATHSALSHGSYPTTLFRIIHKDGEVRFFKSLAKLFTDEKGKKTLIGVNIDVSEQHLNNIALEERNRELEQSNKELASFNHVASHDLQEPLRIIQLYISRFESKATTNLSELGREYFERIKMSVTRMRVLIDDLLLFSRTNKAEKVFEKSDLNILLDGAKQNLSHFIEEKQAIIVSGHLPTIKVIPFQIQQLFTNLIGNSIKYSKPDLAPIIKIECSKVLAKDEPVLNNESLKKYFKISISDNGLGFDQQFAENIFILFHRLHNDNEYSGTGIGLSICKKIVENHSGFIVANGIPGAGSTFTVYLPS